MDSPKKLLLIDDNASNLTLLQGILRDSYKVYPVDSGAVALRFLEKQRPDLILLDIEMPGMNGFEFFTLIREDESLANIPVIFLSGHDAAEKEETAFRLGASDYVRKPVSDVILLARVRLHLELAELRAEKGKV